jgi:hypothetical protein
MPALGAYRGEGEPPEVAIHVYAVSKSLRLLIPDERRSVP